MISILVNNIGLAPKTLHCLIFDKIKNGIKLNDKEYKYWLKIKGKVEKYELIENGCILYYFWGKEYYKNGRRHRDNGPAVEYSNGDKIYYKNGQRHRDDGPAVEYSNVYKAYYKNGQRHREDGPAIERSNGTKAYWINGQLHRDNGPAYVGSNGRKEFWINGKIYSEEEYIKGIYGN